MPVYQWNYIPFLPTNALQVKWSCIWHQKSCHNNLWSFAPLNHLPLVPHICVTKEFIIDSGNGLSPFWLQAIISTIMISLLTHICVTQPEWVNLTSWHENAFHITGPFQLLVDSTHKEPVVWRFDVFFVPSLTNCWTNRWFVCDAMIFMWHYCNENLCLLTFSMSTLKELDSFSWKLQLFTFSLFGNWHIFFFGMMLKIFNTIIIQKLSFLSPNPIPVFTSPAI